MTRLFLVLRAFIPLGSSITSQQSLNPPAGKFDKAIDRFVWLWFLIKPGFYGLDSESSGGRKFTF